MPLEIAPPDQHLAANGALVGRRQQAGLLRMQSDVLVQVARVAERAAAKAALQRLLARMRPQVDLEAILSRVKLAAEQTRVRLRLLQVTAKTVAVAVVTAQGPHQGLVLMQWPH